MVRTQPSTNSLVRPRPSRSLCLARLDFAASAAPRTRPLRGLNPPGPPSGAAKSSTHQAAGHKIWRSGARFAPPCGVSTVGPHVAFEPGRCGLVVSLAALSPLSSRSGGMLCSSARSRVDGHRTDCASRGPRFLARRNARRTPFSDGSGTCHSSYASKRRFSRALHVPGPGRSRLHARARTKIRYMQLLFV